MYYPTHSDLEETTPVLFYQNINMEAYIAGLGSISPQFTYDNSSFLENIHHEEVPYMQCYEPNYKHFIDPRQLRRMSRILKMGVTSAGIALRDAIVELPDAIIIGTGSGMTEDTEKFIRGILDNDEKFSNPTSFIQSTYNTVGAHIALMLKCTKYNFTYVHGSISFENALLDSLMHMSEQPANKILLGGLDEITESHYQITNRAGLWNKQLKWLRPVDKNSDEQILVGEGASFFVLSNTSASHNYAKFMGVRTFFKPKDLREIKSGIESFLDESEISAKDIDLVLYGQNDTEGDDVYNGIKKELFPLSTATRYKHLCGEYYTSTAFASWLAANVLKRQLVPESILLEKKSPAGKLKNILIYNHFRNVNHSLILLSAC